MQKESKELPIDSIDFDRENPRIEHEIDNMDGLTDKEIMRSLRKECKGSLERSILKTQGCSDPIKVKPVGERYVVFEGNTRLFLYKRFRELGKPGNWDLIPAIIHHGVNDSEANEIKIQDHIVGKTQWKAFAKACFYNKLINEDKTYDVASLASSAGVQEKDVEQALDTYEVMTKNYARIVNTNEVEGPDPHVAFNPKSYNHFYNFIRNDRIQEAMDKRGLDTDDFCRWVAEGRLSKAEHVRDNLADLIEDDQAFKILKTRTSKEALPLIYKDGLESELSEAPLIALVSALQLKLDAPNIHEKRRICKSADQIATIQNVQIELQRYLTDLTRMESNELSS